MKTTKKQLLAAAALCLCLLCGCGGAAVPPVLGAEPGENAAGNELTLTQTPSVSSEKYAGKDDFSVFLSQAEKKYLIPALNHAAIP